MKRFLNNLYIYNIISSNMVDTCYPIRTKDGCNGDNVKNIGNDLWKCNEGYMIESTIQIASPTNIGICESNIPIGWTGNCVPGTCDDITIPDSNYAFEPIYGSYSDSLKNVTCNDGYAFNHDILNQSGDITCDYDITSKSMNWFVYNKESQDKCSSITDPNSCNNYEYYPLENLYNESLSTEQKQYMNKYPGGCVWEPNPSPTCKFKIKLHGKGVKKNANTSFEPLCKPLKCPRKIIPNSDRNIYNPLPGPLNSIDRGECMNKDGEILKNITNASDCLCYSNTTCKSCSKKNNCKWCGAGEEGAGCYGKNTRQSICDDHSISSDGTGACINKLDGGSKEGWDVTNNKGQSECELADTCYLYKNDKHIEIPTEISYRNYSEINMPNIKKQYKLISGKDPESDKIACESYNNTYTENVKQSTGYDNSEKVAYLEKYIPGKYSVEGGLRFGLIGDDISINSHICVPSDISNNAEICNVDVKKCTSPSCKVIQNPFDNYKINWGQGNSIYINNCSTPSPDGTISYDSNSNRKDRYSVTDINDKGTIKLKSGNNGEIKLDTSAVNNCKMDYIWDMDMGQPNTEKNSKNNIYNTNELFYFKGHNSAKMVNDPLTCKETEVSGGCSDNNKMYSNFWVESMYLPNSLYDTTGWINTEEPVEYPSVSPASNSLVKKKYYICKNDDLDDDKDDDELNKSINCSHLNKINNDNEDTVHYGQLCKNNTNDKISLKYLCENSDDHRWYYNVKEGGSCINKNNKDASCENFTSNDNNKYTNVGDDNQCIVEVPTTMLNDDALDICKKWEVTGLTSSINFKIGSKSQPVHKCEPGVSFYVPRSDPGPGFPIPSGVRADLDKDETTCKQYTLKYTNKYKYSEENFCPPEDYISDRASDNLTWTGGDVALDKSGNRVSDCNASILSSCDVNCKDGYGGGGMYTCHYNDIPEEICDKIDAGFCDPDTNTDTDCTAEPSEQQDKCQSNPACVYSPPSTDNNNRASCDVKQIDGKPVKGQPEWLGSECYLLNNRAFAHGIYNLPLLNDVFPPLSRLIVFFIIVIILSFIMYKVKIFKGFVMLVKYILTKSSEILSRGTVVMLRDTFVGVFKIFVSGTKMLGLSVSTTLNNPKEILGIIFVCGITAVIAYVAYQTINKK